jgi:Asp/Glu/hydantoin racemase
VAGATVPRIVRPELEDATIAPFLVAARRLEAAGADAIVTSCGFLWPAAAEIRAAVSVPTVVSALEALPALRRAAGPDRPIGILTFDARVLGQSRLDRLDAGPLVIEGLESGTELFAVIAEDRPELDAARARRDVEAATRRLIARAPDLFAVVLECTNMPPYRAAIEAIAQAPVIDVVDMVREAVDNLQIIR